jgi:hypothetical protein
MREVADGVEKLALVTARKVGFLSIRLTWRAQKSDTPRIMCSIHAARRAIRGARAPGELSWGPIRRQYPRLQCGSISQHHSQSLAERKMRLDGMGYTPCRNPESPDHREDNGNEKAPERRGLQFHRDLLFEAASKCYCRSRAEMPAFLPCSFMSSSAFFASSRAFCFWAICCLYWTSCLSHEPWLRRRLPASA